jgi:Ala-tRNA(Pro) deacylase
MPICEKLRAYLDANHVPYITITHSPAYTAQGVAASAHIKGQNLVKTVMVNGDGRHFMLATTANRRLDLHRVREALAVDDAHLEREEDFEALFQDCEAGAMPPFGNLYGLPVVVDESLCLDEEIAFNGGDHRTVVRMPFSDFDRLVRPKKAKLTVGR